MSLLVMGTVALDDIRTSRSVKKDLLGGSAAHFAMSASLFTKVHLVGVVGEDFPKRHVALFRKKGIDLTAVEMKAGKTFHWAGEYDANDWNTAVTKATELGVLIDHQPKLTAAQARIPYVFLANGDPDFQTRLLDQVVKPKFVGLDSMNLWIRIKKPSLIKLIKRVDLFVANDQEAKMITGETNLIKAAKKLNQLGPGLIVIKKGEHGVLVYSKKFMFCFPAFPVEQVIDPTGAGDTFAGGLMGYLARTKKLDCATLKQACLHATACSSFNVEGFGVAKTAGLTLQDVNARVKQLVKFIEP